MKDAVKNLNRAIEHLDKLETFCGTIQRRIDEGNVTAEWLSGVAALIKGNSMAASKIVSDECAVANGFSRSFIAAIDRGIEMEMGGPASMQVQAEDGNVIRIGWSQSQKQKGDDCA